jgi:hypothetical protein
MPNQLTFTTPIAVPDLKFASITEAQSINDSKKRLVVLIEIYGDDHVKHPNIFQVEIKNGSLTKLELHPEPGSTQDILRTATEPLTEVDNPLLANAFDYAMQAYMTGGNTAVLDKLQEWGALPAGTAD